MSTKAKAPAAEKQDKKEASEKKPELTLEERLSKLEKEFQNHQHGKTGCVEVHEPEPEPAPAPAEEAAAPEVSDK